MSITGELSKFEIAVLRMFRNGPIDIPDWLDLPLVETLTNQGLLRRTGEKAELTETGVIIVRSMS